MSLRSEEWEYSMGFSHRDPNAHTRSTAHEQDRQRKREQYLESLSETEHEAYEKVEFCLAALGQYLVAIGEMPHITKEELHKHFPNFALAMGWDGSFYQQSDVGCPAVEISYPDNEGSFWLLNPYLDYSRLPQEEKKMVETEQARHAALEFLKVRFPRSNWDDVKL